MKRVFLNIAMLAFASSLVLSSCKKTDEEPDYSELSQHASDNSTTQRETDQADDDAIALLEGSALSARTSSPSLGSDVVKFEQDPVNSKKYTLVYQGKFSDGKVKTGKIISELTTGNKWTDQDAVLKLTFENVKVTRGNKSVTFTGSKTITNITGKKIKDLKIGDAPIVHNIVSTDLKITFEDGTTRTWNVSKTRKFTKTSDGLQVAVDGTGSNSGYTNLAEWGLTRKGTTFYTSIDKTIVFNECASNDPKPISGKKTHKGLVKEASVTYGVDASGNEISSCNATHYKLNWVNKKGETQTTILAY